MKSTLTAILVILVLASMLSTESPLVLETSVKAEPPVRVSGESLAQAIDRYLEAEPERKELREQARRPERGRTQPRRQQTQERQREPHYVVQREHERHVDQQRHRILKLHAVAEQLQDTGLPELAEQVHRKAEEQHQLLQQQLERMHQPEQGFHREVQESLQQLRHEVHELKREVHELKKVLAESGPKSDS
ncbi:hypothetical protein [Gimesia sp.]|uniref:hypothetical protein n=1 Tax=Gimesia sp. TaxID=2024833 RepID=UPI003A90CCB3